MKTHVYGSVSNIYNKKEIKLPCFYGQADADL